MYVFTYFISIQLRCKIKLSQVNLSQCVRINETPFDVKAKVSHFKSFPKVDTGTTIPAFEQFSREDPQ
jgi:hypothetical protein